MGAQGPDGSTCSHCWQQRHGSLSHPSARSVVGCCSSRCTLCRSLQFCGACTPAAGSSFEHELFLGVQLQLQLEHHLHGPVLPQRCRRTKQALFSSVFSLLRLWFTLYSRSEKALPKERFCLQ